MNVTYSNAVRQEGESFALLQQATKLLEEVLGPSGEAVSAEWDQTRDARGRLVFTLKLSDFPDEASALFTPGELRSPRHVRSRLLSLWGDFLQLRSNAQVKKLLQLVGEGE